MFSPTKHLPGGVIFMTEKSNSIKDKKSSCQRKRNKTTDAYGYKYDRRKGLWSRLDTAILKEGRLLDSWLIPLRI